MADAHLSDGVAVGTVFATERTLDATHWGSGVDVPDGVLSPSFSTHALERTRERLAGRHLGTLGGGNHFLELDRDADHDLWLLVHSGSRGLGAAVAEHHARAAKACDGDRLATLDAEMDEGGAYFRDLSWTLDFARANRRALAGRALEVISDVLGDALDCAEHIDVHHNFVARERWFGRDLYVHRKGAVAVPSGTLALIPGSMGTASYIVEGLGSQEAFGSVVFLRSGTHRFWTVDPSVRLEVLSVDVPMPELSAELIAILPREEYVEVVEEYDDELRSISVAIKAPAVVRLTKGHAPTKQVVRFSRVNVYTRDGFRCQYCGERKTMNALNYDHVIPRARGGRTVWENIVTSCYGCNDRKGSRTVEEAGMKLRRKPFQPKVLPITPAFRLEPARLPSAWRPYCQSFG